MIWELLHTGTLARWWEWPAFIACVVVLACAPTAIWVIWRTRPRDGGYDGF